MYKIVRRILRYHCGWTRLRFLFCTGVFILLCCPNSQNRCSSHTDTVLFTFTGFKMYTGLLHKFSEALHISEFMQFYRNYLSKCADFFYIKLGKSVIVTILNLVSVEKKIHESSQFPRRYYFESRSADITNLCLKRLKWDPVWGEMKH